MVNVTKYHELLQETSGKATLVAVSKKKTAEDIQQLYDLGQRDFAENYVQEIVEKQPLLPKDIRWHFIGHLQTNKVRSIAPFITLIHSVDSFKLLKEINKEGLRNDRIIDCLLQVHIATEETKFGLDESELEELANSKELSSMQNIAIRGFMGMASFTDDTSQIRKEFKVLRALTERYTKLLIANLSQPILSMGMSADYNIALEEGSTLLRIGSLLFGER